jgi:phage terminase small subunit
MSSKAESKLRRALFVQEYIKDRNGTRAVKAAGYKCKTDAAAAVQASMLLRDSKIAAAIDAAIEKRAAAVAWEAVDVLRRLIELADVDISKAFDENGQLLPLHQMPVSLRRAIAAVETQQVGRDNSVTVKKIRFWDKTKALELIGRHLKMFTDKVEATGPNGEPLQAPQVVVVLPPKNSSG